MKAFNKSLAIIISTSFVFSPMAFADKEGTGTLIGGIIGAVIGSQVGGKSGGAKTRGTIIGGLLGALVGNRIGDDMDDKDRREYERASRDCFESPVGRDINWQGNRYSGNVRSTREGYIVYGNDRRVCRDFHSEIYRDDSVETVDGTVCQGNNGWEKYESRRVRYDDGFYNSGSIQDGSQLNQNVQLGFLSPVSRRTGGEYLTLNVSGKNLRNISIQSSGDRVRIYRVIATGINGNQVQLESAQLNTFLYLGQAAQFDLSQVGSQVVRLDILAEAWNNDLGLSINGNSNSNTGSPTPVIGGGSVSYVCASRDNDGRSPYVMAIRRGIQVERLLGETYSSEFDCQQAFRSIRKIAGNSMLCVSRDNDGRNPYQIAALRGKSMARISRTTTNTKMECEQTLNSLRPSFDGIVTFCTSRDNDGRNPYTAVNLDLNSGRVEVGTESFNDIFACRRFLGQ